MFGWLDLAGYGFRLESCPFFGRQQFLWESRGQLAVTYDL